MMSKLQKYYIFEWPSGAMIVLRQPKLEGAKLIHTFEREV